MTFHRTYLADASDADRVLILEDSAHLFSASGGMFLRVRPRCDTFGGLGIHLSRETFAEFVKDAQARLDATAPKFPTKRLAIIKATVEDADATPREGILLSLQDDDDLPWKDAEGETNQTWYGPKDIVSFEVVFEGVED